MNILQNLVWNARQALQIVLQILRYAVTFLLALIQPKAVLAARLLAAESQLAVCKHRIQEKKDPRPRFTACFWQLPCRAVSPTAASSASMSDTWLDEGLVDLLTVNGPVFGLPLEEYVLLVRDAGCQLFARIINNPGVLRSPEVLRGTVSNYLHDGADGVYFFNFSGRERAETARLHEVGDAGGLARLDKRFCVPQRPHPFPAVVHTVIRPPEPTEPLPINLIVLGGDRGQTVPVKVGDDLEAAVRDGVLKEARLLVKLQNFSIEEDRISFKLNGEPLPDYKLMSERTWAEEWLEFNFNGPPLRQGKNTLEAILERRNPAITGPLVLGEIEVVIAYETVEAIQP